MFKARPSIRRLPLLLALAGLAGCGGTPEAENDRPWAIDPAMCKPVKGTITLRGKPIAKVVVAFFAASGVPSAGESDAEGHYTLKTMNNPGAPPGDYKVVLSYYLAPDGSAQGLSARSAMTQSEAMIASRETLPPSYSDINQTTLRATVPADGDEIDFDINADPKPPPHRSAPAREKAGKEIEGPDR